MKYIVSRRNNLVDRITTTWRLRIWTETQSQCNGQMWHYGGRTHATIATFSLPIETNEFPKTLLSTVQCCKQIDRHAHTKHILHFDWMLINCEKWINFPVRSEIETQLSLSMAFFLAFLFWWKISSFSFRSKSFKLSLLHHITLGKCFKTLSRNWWSI